MFRLEVLPVSYGDCILLEYGAEGPPYRMLVDGGPLQSLPTLRRCLNSFAASDRWLELLVLTHVDADHVEGLIRILGESPCRIAPREIWFNGWNEFRNHDSLSALRGEFFAALLSKRFKNQHNRRWPLGSVVVPDEGHLPCILFDGGMNLTLLSPTSSKLAELRRSWQRELSDRNLAPGDLDAAWARLLATKSLRPRDHQYLGGGSVAGRLIDERFRGDDSAANGSSICFLAEQQGGGSVLLLADAHSDTVIESLDRLLEERGVDRLRVDAMKLAHHGSRYNFDPAIFQRVESAQYIVSTDGTRFGHPDAEVVEAIIRDCPVRPPNILFNYLCATTERWNSPSDQALRDYRATYAPPDQSLIVCLPEAVPM